MTRKEEIINAAYNEAEVERQLKMHPQVFEQGFVAGAKWADEHPSLHVVASLMHLLRSGRIDTTTTNADVLTQLQIELKNRDKTNQSKAL